MEADADQGRHLCSQVEKMHHQVQTVWHSAANTHAGQKQLQAAVPGSRVSHYYLTFTKHYANPGSHSLWYSISITKFSEFSDHIYLSQICVQNLPYLLKNGIFRTNQNRVQNLNDYLIGILQLLIPPIKWC